MGVKAGVREVWTTNSPELPEGLTLLPYVPGIAEYAARVREEVLERSRSDFIIAVDLPRGYENLVMEAVQKLPEVSVIVDRIGRGIPIIPTSAPVEAVRSFMEHGLDLRFIAPSLPVIGNSDDYTYFLSLCGQYGIRSILANPEKFGIQSGDLTGSFEEMATCDAPPVRFCHLPGDAMITQIPSFIPGQESAYRKTRLQYMASHLRNIVREGIDVLFVCGWYDLSGVLYFLNKNTPLIQDHVVIPSELLMLCEADIPHVSSEIPYVMYLYNVFRDTGVGRKAWIQSIFCGTDYSLSSSSITAVDRYAHSLALADGELSPALYNLVAAAKFVVDDNYALKVYDLARSYPPARNTKPDARIQPILDFNLKPLEDRRSLTLTPSLLAKKYPPLKGMIGNKHAKGSWYSRWIRTEASYRAEQEMMAYMTPRYTAMVPAEDDYSVHECQSGLCEGFDVRETIRNRATGKIYVREQTPINGAAYVIDYRSMNADPGHQRKDAAMLNQFHSHFFLDRYYAWIGVGKYRTHHYDSGVVIAFCRLDFSPTLIFCDIVSSRPLASSVEIALTYAKNVFVFTDFPEEIMVQRQDLSRLRIMPLDTIPESVRRCMQHFDIAYYRHDDRRGD